MELRGTETVAWSTRFTWSAGPEMVRTLGDSLGGRLVRLIGRVDCGTKVTGTVAETSGSRLTLTVAGLTVYCTPERPPLIVTGTVASRASRDTPCRSITGKITPGLLT